MVVSPAYRVAVTIPFVSVLVLVLGLIVSAGHAGASNILDYVTFDGVDYIRWPQEPGRSLTREDLGIEFATIECSLGEDLRGCPYGVDASAAFMPAGTRVYAVRGYATEFRLAAVWKDPVFLFQAWRNPRAKVGGDLYDLRDRVRAIDVRRGEPTSTSTAPPVKITAPGEVAALVDMVARGAMHRPLAHAIDEPRYWLTFWLADGTTLERPYFVETRELLGGVVLPDEFAALL